MSYKVEKITAPVVLGEGPHWDARQQALFFISVLEHTIHKYVPATREHTKTTLDGPPGHIVPVEGAPNQFVLGVNRTFQIIEWDGREGSKVKVVKVIGEVDENTQNKINDGKADPRGRLFAGTMISSQEEKELGSLYRIDSGQIEKVEEKIMCSNGMAWDLKEKAYYYIDSMERIIRRYDYDVDTGAISNRRDIFDFRKKNVEGYPDGATIDTDGNLWVAVFDGYCVLKIDPRTGEVLQKVPIEVKQVTSVTFGGPNHDVLFVTTASINHPADTERPPGGATYMVTGLGVRGQPNLNFKL